MSGPVLTSTSSTREEMEHALSAEWRDPAALQMPKPQETPEAEQQEQPEVSPEEAKTTADEGKAEQSESKEPKKKSGYEKRIDKLTAKNYQAETRAEKAERELAELREKLNKPEKSAQQPDGEPKWEDFHAAGKTVNDWYKAMRDYESAQAEEAEKTERAREKMEAYNRAVSEIQGKVDDWDEVVVNNGNKIKIPESVQLAVFSLKENGPAVTYYLAKNPDVCEELMEMRHDSAAVIMRIKEIAMSLAPQKNSPPPKPKVVPPAPIATVGASSTRSSTPLDQLSPREYIAARNRQEAAKRGR